MSEDRETVERLVDLSRNLIKAWQGDTCVYDRGTPADQEELEALWAAMTAALDREETVPRLIELAQKLIAAWRADTCVYDRGSPADERWLNALWVEMERALDRGAAGTAQKVMSLYHKDLIDYFRTHRPHGGA